MPYKNIKVTLTNAQMNAIKTSIDSIMAILNSMVNLTTAERRQLYRIGAGEIPFLEVSQQIATNFQFFPVWLSKTDFDQDVALMKNMKQIQRWLAPLNEGLNDTYWAANQEAISAALSQYKAIQAASKRNVAGTDELNNNLKKFFKKKKRKPKSETPAA